MNNFSENYCRICTGFFCCKNCRLRHEETYHNIHRECDICVYGKAPLKQPSESLLQHLAEKHLPLHCLYCKTVFTTSEELILHSTCSTRQKHNWEKSNMVITPVSAAEQSYDSPPVTAIMHKSILTSSNKHFVGNNTVSLTTSTPMHKFDERELLDNIPEFITPVDYSENTNKLKQSQINETDETPTASEQLKNNEPPRKRRVTFCETPIIHGSEYRKRANDEPSEENGSGCKFSKVDETDASDIYETAEKGSNSLDCINSSKGVAYRGNYKREKILTRSATPKNRDSASYKQVSNDTLWESALMDHSKSEASSSLLPFNLLEARVLLPKLQASDLPSSEVKLNAKDYNIVSSPTFNQYLINPDQENFTALTPNVSPIISSSFTKTNNPFSMVNPNVLNINNLMPIANQNVIKVDIHFPITNLNLGEPKNVPPENADCWNIAKTEDAATRQKQGIWSSVANIVRTVVKGLSGSPHALKDAEPDKKNIGKSHKRPKPDCDVSTEESPIRKKIKLTDIRCRRTIRPMSSFKYLKYYRKNVRCVDKSTQTD